MPVKYSFEAASDRRERQRLELAAVAHVERQRHAIALARISDPVLEVRMTSWSAEAGGLRLSMASR